MEGENKVNKLLKNDLVIRIISILFAISLWFFVLSDTNPYSTAYISVPIKFINENTIQEKGLEIKNKNYQKEIIVAVEGRNEKVNSIDSSYFEAVVDFSEVKEAGAVDVGVKFAKLKENINVKSYNPISIRLDLEKIEEKTFEIQVRTEGIPKEKYYIIGGSAFPNSITIRGMESMISSIASAVVAVDVNGLDKNLVMKKDCKLYDINGNEITELSGRYIVDVKVDVAKEVAVVPVIQGMVSSGYVEKERIVYPQSIMIKGAPEILTGINEIRTAPVNIEGYTKDLDVKVPLNLPEGVELYNFSNEVRVNISVEQLATREFNISRGEINLINDNSGQNYKVEIMTPSVNVKVRGGREEVERVEQSKFMPTVYLNYVTEGTHKLPLNITLPNNVKLVEDIFVEVRVTKVEVETPTPSPSPSPAPSE